MKISYEEKRQQFWIAAYEKVMTFPIMDHDSASEFADSALRAFEKKFPEQFTMTITPGKIKKQKLDKSAEKMFLDSHNVLLKIRNHVAPNTPLNNELFVEVKNNLEYLKDYISFLGKIQALFPSITDEKLLSAIKNNKESHDRLEFIKKFYDITWSDESVLVLPKITLPSKIIPERDAFNPLPPEYPNGDDLTPKQGHDTGCYDTDCLSKTCNPECENLKCNSSPPRETPERDTNTYIDKI